MEVKFLMADKTTIKQAVELCKNCAIMVNANKVEKVGVRNVLTEKDMSNVIVALLGEKVIGALRIASVEKDFYDWFECKTEEKPLEISAICVDERYRGKNVAGKMLEFVKRNNQKSTLYADVMIEPVSNTASHHTFIKSGFKNFASKPWFYPQYNLTFLWKLYKFKID